MGNLSERLLEVLSPEAVGAFSRLRTLQRLPGVIADPSQYFNWSDLETLLQRDRGNAADYRFCKGGQVIGKEMFKLVGDDNSLNPRPLQAMADQGVAIVVNRVNQKFSSFWRDVQRLDEALRIKGQLVCFSSLAPAQGFPLHYDAVDAIIVQTVGRKHWTFYGEPVAGPLARHVEPKPTSVTCELVMEAGDVLFLPSGLHHQCRALEPSIHLAFLLERPSGFDLLKHLAVLHEADTILGTQILPGEEARQQQALLKERLIELVHQIDLDGFTRDWSQPPDSPPLILRPKIDQR
jgi:hypothetical protein